MTRPPFRAVARAPLGARCVSPPSAIGSISPASVRRGVFGAPVARRISPRRGPSRPCSCERTRPLSPLARHSLAVARFAARLDAMGQAELDKRAEIYTYQSSGPVYALNWSVRVPLRRGALRNTAGPRGGEGGPRKSPSPPRLVLPSRRAARYAHRSLRSAPRSALPRADCRDSPARPGRNAAAVTVRCSRRPIAISVFAEANRGLAPDGGRGIRVGKRVGGRGKRGSEGM